MDSLTHIVLGGALAQILIGRRAGYMRAFLVGGLAATMPDLDVFIHTGDALRNHALHRHFTHALVLAPVLAAVALVPFLIHSRARPLATLLHPAALVACASHSLLDLLTSYGTMILWPFSERRYALDVIAVVDLLYTLPLVADVIWTIRRKTLAPALAALAVSCAYLGLAQWQHARAAAAQAQLLAARHETTALNPRALPQVGAVVSYRSIYIADGQIHADAIRVPFLGATSFKPGGSIPLATASDLQNPAVAHAAHDFATFADMADGYVARSPRDPLLLTDLRYAYTPEGRDAVWGVQLEQTDHPLFRITPRWSYFGILARDLFRPRGYAAIPASIDR